MNNKEVLTRMVRLYEELLGHEGYGEIRIEMRLLKRGQKEVILHCGKQYRYVVDCTDRRPLRWGVWRADELPCGAATDALPGASRQGFPERRHQSAPIDFADRRRPQSSGC